MKWRFPAAILLAGAVALLSLWGIGEPDGVPVMASDEALAEAVEEVIPQSPPSPFEAYTYYHTQNHDRYQAYWTLLPELDAGTVVWQVNAGLDIPPYTEVREAAGDHPLLVNKRYALPEAFAPAELVIIHSSVQATPGTAEAFQRMRSAAMKDNVFIEAASGYRSLESQADLFREQELYLGTEAAEAVVARPGHGEHGTGRALHIVDRNYSFDDFDTMPEYAWLLEHGAEYGFILRYPQGAEEITGFAWEPYHFTFVGREIALAMAELGIATLEEYVARGLGPAGGNLPIDDRTVVVLVAGFGGEEDVSYESELVLLIKEQLEEESIRVVIARDGVDVENETKTAVLIGIRREDDEGPGGAVAWFASDRPESGSFAQTVESRLTWAGLDVESRGIYDDSKISLTRRTEAPAVLLELSPRWMGEDYTGRMAKAVSDAVVAHLGLRTMYLTFDDGPSAKNTPAVLDILQEKGVKATFFVVGGMAEQNPELLREIVARGHTIGIHCYSHDYNEIYASAESFFEDLDKAREAIREITGLEPVICRFPGGSINNYNTEVYQEIIAELDSRGFVYYDWNIASGDTTGTVQAGEFLHYIQEQPRYRNAVLLMHDAYPHIAAELSDIIDHFADYRMDVITEETQPVQFRAG